MFRRNLPKPGMFLLTANGRNSRRTISLLAWFFVLTALFALAYNQAPLFTSNQNQYFLHGYAQAGVGTLSEDWLANTADPTPVFSLLVGVTIRLFHTGNLFFIYYAFLMGIYFCSLFGISEQVFPLRSSRLTTLAFIATIIGLHSTLFRYLLMRLFGGEWPYLFEGGVAGQRLLGPVFQPSTFGVFLLLSLYLYLKDRKYLAVLSAVLAATFHPTYLLSAASLTLAYLVDTFRRDKKIKLLLRMVLLALVTVAPILIYTYLHFWGGPAEIAVMARDILVNVRIPPHAIVSVWFNSTVVVKLLIVGIGLFLIRRHRLFELLVLPLFLCIGLTLVQAISKSDLLALIFPWRLSTWLVPVLLGLSVAWLITSVLPRVRISWERTLRAAGLVLISLSVAAGMIRIYLEKVESAGLPSRPLEAFVAAQSKAGQIYLTPRSLFDFRLETGAPIYVDFLSIPYQNEDVLEWDIRYRATKNFYQAASCEQLGDFSGVGVTHVVLPVDFPGECSQLVMIYEDSTYKLFELHP